MMVRERVNIQDLFPAARELFKPDQKRRPRLWIRLVGWILAGLAATLLGRRILSWFDRNL